MPPICRLRPVLATTAALAAALAPAAASADQSLQAVINLSTGYTDNVQLAPENPIDPAATGPVSSDTFADIAPGLVFSYLGRRTVQVFTYTLALRLYRGATEANSFSNRLAYGLRFALGPRSRFGFDFSATQDRLNSFDAAPQDTVVGVRADGDQSFLEATAQQSYSYQLARAWRFQQSLGVSVFEPTDDTVQIGLRSAFDGELGLSRIFASDALTLSARGTFSTFDLGEDVAGNDLGQVDTVQVGPELRWVHDLSENFSTDATIGAVAVMPAFEFESRDQFAVGSALLRYQRELYRASIGYQRAVAPDIALARTEVAHVVEARGVVPLPVRDRRFRDKLLLSGAGGYSSGEFVRLTGDAGVGPVGHTEAWVADAALSWDVSSEITATLRYQRVWQDLEDPAFMMEEPQRTRRQQVLFVLQGRYPSRAAAVLPGDPTTRVYGGLVDSESERDERGRRGEDERGRERRGEGEGSDSQPDGGPR